MPSLAVGNIEMTSVLLDEETFARADCVVVPTAHTAIDYEFVAKAARLILDT